MPEVVHETLCDHLIYYLEHDCKDDKDLRDAGLEAKQCLKDRLITQAEFNKIVEVGKRRRQEINDKSVC